MLVAVSSTAPSAVEKRVYFLRFRRKFDLQRKDSMERVKLSSVLAVLWLFLPSDSSLATDQITVQFKRSANQAEVELHSQMTLPVSAMYPEYLIQRSSDMVN